MLRKSTFHSAFLSRAIFFDFVVPHLLRCTYDLHREEAARYSMESHGSTASVLSDHDRPGEELPPSFAGLSFFLDLSEDEVSAFIREPRPRLQRRIQLFYSQGLR